MPSIPFAALAAVLLALTLTAGCDSGKPLDSGANQSLVEIGERSLEEAEALEGQGRAAEANTAYRKALWAFRYHQELTGDVPFLMDAALDGIKRTGRRYDVEF